MFIIKFCWWLDSNYISLVLEAVTLPTEPQPLPALIFLLSLVSFVVKWSVYFLQDILNSEHQQSDLVFIPQNSLKTGD